MLIHGEGLSTETQSCSVDFSKIENEVLKGNITFGNFLGQHSFSHPPTNPQEVYDMFKEQLKRYGHSSLRRPLIEKSMALIQKGYLN